MNTGHVTSVRNELKQMNASKVPEVVKGIIHSRLD